MTYVLIYNYSKFYDPRTDTQFMPVLHQSTGQWVGVADVEDPEKLAYFEKNPAFKVLSVAEYEHITVRPVAPEPTEPTTGDPLADAVIHADDSPAKAAKAEADPLAGPPAPPTAKK